MNNVSIRPVAARNELLIGVHEAAGESEDVVAQFLKDYSKGEILE
ncbi:hypothetical protein [Metabacillus lacus]|nr:hypothetical protein [Metabacillus lacus]